MLVGLRATTQPWSSLLQTPPLMDQRNLLCKNAKCTSMLFRLRPQICGFPALKDHPSNSYLIDVVQNIHTFDSEAQMFRHWPAHPNQYLRATYPAVELFRISDMVPKPLADRKTTWCILLIGALLVWCCFLVEEQYPSELMCWTGIRLTQCPKKTKNSACLSVPGFESMTDCC